MNLNKSIDRLKWRFKNCFLDDFGNKRPKPTAFIPSKKDVDSLNEIIEYVDNKEREQIIDNQLFGKLYIYLIGQFMTHYDCSITEGRTQIEINKILDTPLKKLVQDLLEKENLKQLEYSIEINNDPNPKKMDYKEISENLKIMINAAINTYKPKHLEEV